jgi:predicted transcriptional regulator
MAEWTFLTKHAIALSLIAKHPRITAIEVATSMGITERAIRKLIADLYTGGYIGKRREGRGVKYSINPDRTLRHETLHDIAIGDFLAALGWKKDTQENK